MAQIILDEQLHRGRVFAPLTRWITAQRLQDVRPLEVIKDDRVPMLLRELRQPTFVTIDAGFWNPRLRDPRYCILFFPLDTSEQHEPPGLLHRLLRLLGFRTKAARMGTVARVSAVQIDVWQVGSETMQRLTWS